MAASLENVILQLLVPNNEALSQGFHEMREAFKDPGINIALCECMTNSQNLQVRQYAAVLLRKKLMKARQWKRVPPRIKEGIKRTVLQLFVHTESEHSLHMSIIELLAAIAKHDLPTGKWPELMQLMNQCIQSNKATEKEMGLNALSIITSTIGENLKPQVKSLLSIFSKTLLDNSSTSIPFYTILCLTHLVSSVGTEEMNLFQALIPSVLLVIRNLAATDEVRACAAMEIFDELVESEVAVIIPHIKPLIGFCLELAGNRNLGPSTRIKAMAIISWLTRLKKKTILKHKLINPILDVLFPVMCQPCPGDQDGTEEEDEDDEQSPTTVAAQVIDMMALHLPPEKLIPPLMHHMEPALNSTDPHHKKAAYLALAVIAEGCSEYIRNKCLQNYLQVICKGIQEENSIVRNAALYSLGQFAEFLQPEISKFASDLLPVLFDYLQHTCQLLQQDGKDPPSLTKTFYALGTFCENLEDKLLPYLPSLMETLLTFITCTKSVTAKELSINAIGAVASAAKESFVPYFPSVIENLKVFISEKNDANMPLKIQAIDTLGILAKTVGDETFMPMAHDCMRLGLELVDQVDDPDLRRCTFNLFSSVSTVLKSEMTQYLPSIVEHMIGSIQSNEGVNTHYALEENTGFTLFEDAEDDDLDDDETPEDQEDEENDEIAGYSVENAYMEEKESACIALKEISSTVGVIFIPFIDKAFDEVKKLLESPAIEVRREAMFCLGQFCITLDQVFHETGSLEHRMALEQKLGSLLPKLFSTAREDTEFRVVIACLETLQDMMEKIKKNVLHGSTLESAVMLIKDVYKQKLACQDEDEDDDLDDQEAEFDTALVECAGDLIPELVKIVPSQQFAPYLAGLLPFILPKTKKTCTVSEKSFSIGTLADVVNSMEPGASRQFLSHFLPVFLGGMKDENDEVRSNAVYGLGVLIQNAAEAIFPQYPSLLQALSTMLSQEDNPRAKDNLCAAVARMIMTNTVGVPLKQVFPAVLQCLPLQEDLDENITVYKCLSHLYSNRCEEFFQNLPHILKILSAVLSSQKIDDELAAVIVHLVKAVHLEFPNDFETVLQTLPQEGSDALRAALSHS